MHKKNDVYIFIYCVVYTDNDTIKAKERYDHTVRSYIIHNSNVPNRPEPIEATSLIDNTNLDLLSK